MLRFDTGKLVEASQTRRQDPHFSTGPPQHVADERRALLQSVLESRTFAKSTRLAHFLRYICTQAIDGNAKDINEQQIGVHVFARSPMYSASDDSIVRTQARLLRQRLEEYFEHEAPNSSQIISIPKGGYVPVFEARTLPAAAPPVEPAGGELPIAPPPPAAPPQEFAPHRRARFVAGLASAFVALLLIFAGVYAWLATRHTTTASDLVWSRIFGEGRPVLIVPSDDALVLFEEQLKTTIPLSEYLSGSYLNQGKLSPGLAFTSDWFAAHQYTSTADLNLAMRLGRLPAAYHAQLQTRYARGLRIDDLKGSNVILIGGLASNPWVNLFQQRLDFQVNYDWKSNEGYVLNKRPQKGEESVYRDKAVDGSQHSYGVLAFLPGIEDQGEALLFEGTGMAGTESASDFPFDPAAFVPFSRRIGATPQRMPYFEALLETTSVGGNAPEIHVITYHLIQP